MLKELRSVQLEQIKLGDEGNFERRTKGSKVVSQAGF